MAFFVLAGATGIFGIATGVAAEAGHNYVAAVGTLIIIILMDIALVLEHKRSLS